MPTKPTPHPDALRIAMEPRRLHILELVWDREMCVSDIAETVPISMAAVSQHLARLKAAGLVSVRAEGRKRYYRATRADLGALAIVLESFWTDRLGALKGLAESMERAADRSRTPPETPGTSGDELP